MNFYEKLYQKKKAASEITKKVTKVTNGVNPQLPTADALPREVTNRAQKVTNRAQMRAQMKYAPKKCIGIDCKHVTLKNEILLFCRKNEKPVIDFQVCPLNLWRKNPKNRPIPGHNF